MNIRLILAALLFSAATYAQCTECESISEAEKNPTQVKELTLNSYLSDEEFEAIPASVFTFTNIEVLYMTDFGFTEIPKEIGNLKKLKSLSFAGNELETLPDEIFTLTNLKELLLSYNAFSEDYKAYIQKTVKEKLPNTRLIID